VKRSQFKLYFQNLMRKEKSYWSLKPSLTQEFQLRNRSISEYLIKWRKLPAEDSTWEDESFIQKHPELLKRCGQHLSQGEGHVKP
jgi:hypothetical protein